MAQFDKNAVDATAIAVKLRHAETNAKIPRTPYNIEAAIVALMEEAIDLSGEEATYQLMRHLAQGLSLHKGWEASRHPSDQTQLEFDIAAGVEMLVNMEQEVTEGAPGEQVAGKILSELRDMELLSEVVIFGNEELCPSAIVHLWEALYEGEIPETDSRYAKLEQLYLDVAGELMPNKHQG